MYVLEHTHTCTVLEAKEEKKKKKKGSLPSRSSKSLGLPPHLTTNETRPTERPTDGRAKEEELTKRKKEEDTLLIHVSLPFTYVGDAQGGNRLWLADQPAGENAF